MSSQKTVKSAQTAPRILHIASENDALIGGKVGGIGDVIRDVPKFSAMQGLRVDVITPGYGIHGQNQASSLIRQINVEFRGQTELVELHRVQPDSQNDGTEHAAVSHWFLEHPLFYQHGRGRIYVDDGEHRPFASDANKFALFCVAICELLNGFWLRQFNIIHLHDWHTGLIPVLSRFVEKYASLQQLHSVYSIHNLALQGIRPLDGDESSLKAWFPDIKIDETKISDPRYHNCFNPTRSAINLCNAIHVVSPTYAQEVVRPSNVQQGFIGGEGLHLDLQRAQQQGRLFGILNGCDYDYQPVLNATPENPVAAEHFDFQMYDKLAMVLEQWQASHHFVHAAHLVALQRLEQWRERHFNGPLVTSIGRLTGQKVALLLQSVDRQLVIEQLMQELANIDGRMIILGSGDPGIEDEITKVMQSHDNLLFINGYHHELPKYLFEGGDLFLMPSSFEPCGISQMLALRSGQPCLVHDIGGLHDTVIDEQTGFVFAGDNPTSQAGALVKSFQRALNKYQKQPAAWLTMRKQSAAQRFLWQDSIEQYRHVLYKD
ncbi:glycogen synthase [Thalassotalea mangrovi]|uniref:starch synthase n=1 Tax=Thalassotalea mangrovi TaxID=2572245 RepID=A0A4U1BBB9_9GAMM|nr:glycogen/starch synthase [Thalassotalea mangrovi]TKB47717.1 glycogen synthase [Thalassotalea mangrovi]